MWRDGVKCGTWQEHHGKKFDDQNFIKKHIGLGVLPIAKVVKNTNRL